MALHRLPLHKKNIASATSYKARATRDVVRSAGHQQNANTNASTSPPLTAQPSPLTPEDQHRELDELLSDMMLTVQSIPDLKPHQQQQQQHQRRTAEEDAAFDDAAVRYIDEDGEDRDDIPYHARQDSRPFSYTTMIAEAKGLNSPSLVGTTKFRPPPVLFPIFCLNRR